MRSPSRKIYKHKQEYVPSIQHEMRLSNSAKDTRNDLPKEASDTWTKTNVWKGWTRKHQFVARFALIWFRVQLNFFTDLFFSSLLWVSLVPALKKENSWNENSDRQNLCPVVRRKQHSYSWSEKINTTPTLLASFFVRDPIQTRLSFYLLGTLRTGLLTKRKKKPIWGRKTHFRS